MNLKPPTYFKNIDALRLITFLLVFLRHGFFSNNKIIEQNYLVQWHDHYFNVAAIGLDFFSVLSSFLITWLILNEYQANSNFILKNFYARRILRIWPLYFLMIAIGYIAIPMVAKLIHIEIPELPNVLWFLTFTSNYYAGYIDQNFVFFLVFLWFVCVEEQFYLVWGLVLKYLKEYMDHICIVLLAVYVLIKYIFATSAFPSFFDTVNYLPNFCIGAYLAKSTVSKNAIYQKLIQLKKYVWVSVYLVLAVVFLFYNQLFESYHAENLKHILLSVLFALIIFENCFTEKSLFNLSKYKIINYVGTLNYGLYCWHGLVITLIKKSMEYSGHTDSIIDVFFIYPIITLTLTIGISIVSFEYFEKRFLNLKKYFTSVKYA
jgi:peptidoglycan/LPS O-acetylase OafA/YrhL